MEWVGKEDVVGEVEEYNRGGSGRSSTSARGAAAAGAGTAAAATQTSVVETDRHSRFDHSLSFPYVSLLQRFHTFIEENVESDSSGAKSGDSESDLDDNVDGATNLPEARFSDLVVTLGVHQVEKGVADPDGPYFRMLYVGELYDGVETVGSLSRVLSAGGHKVSEKYVREKFGSDSQTQPAPSPRYLVPHNLLGRIPTETHFLTKILPALSRDNFQCVKRAIHQTKTLKARHPASGGYLTVDRLHS